MNRPPPAGLEPPRSPSRAHRVAVTRWSVVSQAALAGPSEEREIARNDICRNYWYPMYVYLRRIGHSATVAEDYVQGFFLELFEKNVLASADPERGKFRTFLLTALERYAAHRHRVLFRGHSLVLRGAEAYTRGSFFDAHRRRKEAAAGRAGAARFESQKTRESPRGECLARINTHPINPANSLK